MKDFQLNLHIDQQVQPVAQPLRRPAFSLREKIEKKLDELLQEDIIEKVEGPTPWVNPAVVVPKSIIRKRHPIPTTDEVLEDIARRQCLQQIGSEVGLPSN